MQPRELLERELERLKRENRALREQAHQDDLTGLGNRRSFRRHLEQAVELTDRYGTSFAVMVLDLDGMKQLNDRAGHPAGDLALSRVGDALRAQIRSVDHAARLGGDEFAVVMPHVTAPQATLVAERIRQHIATLPCPGDVRVTASFGVTMLTPSLEPGVDADELFARADQALYQAKRAGRDRVVLDDAIPAEMAPAQSGRLPTVTQPS